MPRASSLLGLALPVALLATASASEACTVSAVGVAFGSYDPQSATPDDGVGTLTLLCAPSVGSALATLGPGLNGTFLSRAMANGSDQLNYNLYTDSARTIVWGNGTSGSSTVTMTGSVSAGQRRMDRIVYGRIPASQNVSSGAYSDTLVIIVSF